MLILSRKSNESIVIGDNIRITVTCIRGRYVRLGIEAPEHVGIYREELLRTIDAIPAEVDNRDRVEGDEESRLVSRAGVLGMDTAVALNV